MQSPFKLTAIAALTFVLSAPVPAATIPAGTQLHPTQTLVRSNGSEPESMDPAVAETVPANQILRDLFEGLTATDTTGKTVPGVAESWKQTNPTTWVFKLRTNAKFSNGDPITAEDFVYGIRRFVDPKTASPYAATFGVFLQNGLEIAQGKKPTSELGVKALDKHTLEIKTQDPIPFMAELVSNTQLGPVHKATVEKWGKEWVKPGNMVGNGAYKLKEWKVNNRIVVEKNPNYWDAANAPLTQVTYLPIEDQFADIKLWESGETDYVYQMPPGVFDKYKAQYPKELRNQAIIGVR
jgi:oligopeptide transport system substrate-binding protein